MTTATLQRELKKIVKKHEEIGKDIGRVLALATHEKDLPYGDWELKPSALRRIDRARRAISRGKGARIRTQEDMDAFFKSL